MGKTSKIAGLTVVGAAVTFLLLGAAAFKGQPKFAYKFLGNTKAVVYEKEGRGTTATFFTFPPVPYKTMLAKAKAELEPKGFKVVSSKPGVLIKKSPKELRDTWDGPNTIFAKDGERVIVCGWMCQKTHGKIEYNDHYGMRPYPQTTVFIERDEPDPRGLAIYHVLKKLALEG